MGNKDHCIEYDKVGNLIQMDTSTQCNSFSNESVYKSSNLLFCDPKRCLSLPKKASNPTLSRTELTTLPVSTPNSTNTNEGDSKPNQPLESWHYVLGALLPVFLVIGFVIIFFKYKKHQTNEPSENGEKDQMNPPQNGVAVTHPTTSRLKILLQYPGLNRIRYLYQIRNTEEIPLDNVV